MKKITLPSGDVALVDDQDYDLVSKHKWHVKGNSNQKYATTHKPGREVGKIYMHRLICNPPKGKEVDHINHNGLDNRRSNLRICSRSENLRNGRGRRKPHSSKYKGVSWHKRDRKWIPLIKVNGKQTYLGRFGSEEDARDAYDRAAKKYFGEFARLNVD